MQNGIYVGNFRVVGVFQIFNSVVIVFFGKRIGCVFRYDADEFVQKINATNANPLSLLTEGLHIHTVAVKDEQAFSRIKEKLSNLGILIEST